MRSDARIARDTGRGAVATALRLWCALSRRHRGDDGFTLPEVLITAGVFVIVLTAAYGVLSTTNTTLNVVQSGSQAYEKARATIDAFKRDVWAVAALQDYSGPIVTASPSVCSMTVLDKNDVKTLVTWTADSSTKKLYRSVTYAAGGVTPSSLSQFTALGSTTTTTTMLTGLTNTNVFTYMHSATDPITTPDTTGIVWIRIRNMIDPVNGVAQSGQSDLQDSARLMSYVVNGY